MSRTPEYQAYLSAKKRCLNLEDKHYGGRGIEFRFKSFAEFFAELGPRPSPQHSLDRKNNDGNYEPGNCRWATKSEQMKNRRPPQLPWNLPEFHSSDCRCYVCHLNW